MPGYSQTRLYRVYKVEANSRREELEIYEEPSALLPFCLLYRTHVIRSYSLEVILNFRRKVEDLVYAGRLISYQPILSIVHFLGYGFCVIKLKVCERKVVVLLHVHV